MVTEMLYQVDALNKAGKPLSIILPKDSVELNVMFLKSHGYTNITTTEINTSTI
jgi:hypothetical protein